MRQTAFARPDHVRLDLGRPGPAVIAIPAHNEAREIERCLAALAVQRDLMGAPVEAGAFQVLVFANNCTDRTAAVVNDFASRMPHPLRVVEAQLPIGQRNAGWARKHAMDLAAAAIMADGTTQGLIMTTDADSQVAPTWFAATTREFEQGADCVAGYIDANPLELVSLGRGFLQRSRREDGYLRLLAEIEACCDPRPHDPWPNHRVASGASLAVTLSAYPAIGGLPPRPVGEDQALTKALDRAGFRVRHAMAVSVITSCRFDGRAPGGAADTIRHRHAVPDAPCDDEIEPALHFMRRVICRRMLRGVWEQPGSRMPVLLARLGIAPARAALIGAAGADAFEDFWHRICAASPVLAARRQLRPADLPRQIAMAQIILRHLRARTAPAQIVPTGKYRRERSLEPANVQRSAAQNARSPARPSADSRSRPASDTQ